MIRLFLFVAFLIFPLSAQAQMISCLETETVSKRLFEQHEEVPTHAGVGSNGGLMVIYTSEKTGTFTVAVQDPNGLSCIVFSGEGWEMINPKKKSF